MAVLKEIRKRIVSVQNTQQITKAMKMVAASKLRKAQQEVESARPYTTELGKIISRLNQASGGQAASPLFKRENRSKAVILVVNSDRGLCGAMNNNLNKAVLAKSETLKNEFGEVELSLFGRKSREFFKKFAFEQRSYSGDLKESDYKKLIQEESDKLIRAFLDGKVDSVFIGYNLFKSVICQEPVIAQLLPVAPPAEEEAEIPTEDSSDFIYEPSAEEILETLLKKFILNQSYTSLLNNIASEHGARMAAMDAATNNANEVISALKLQYNRARQAAITKELIEIISGADAIS